MPRQSSYQYVYSLLSKHGILTVLFLHAFFFYLPLLLPLRLLYYKMVLLGLRLLILRLDTETCYGYDFTLIVRDFKIISLYTIKSFCSKLNAKAWLSELTHVSACSIRRKNTGIIVKSSNITNNTSHLLSEDVYKTETIFLHSVSKTFQYSPNNPTSNCPPQLGNLKLLSGSLLSEVPLSEDITMTN